MPKQKSVLNGIVQCKCPICRQGNLFKNTNPYNFKEILTMNSQCEFCGFFYEKEPGFWTGAMYVSYGIIVAIVFLSLLVLYLILKMPIETVLPVSIGTVVLGYPLLLRYSRVIYLYLLS